MMFSHKRALRVLLFPLWFYHKGKSSFIRSSKCVVVTGVSEFHFPGLQSDAEACNLLSATISGLCAVLHYSWLTGQSMEGRESVLISSKTGSLRCVLYNLTTRRERPQRITILFPRFRAANLQVFCLTRVEKVNYCS